MAWSADNPDFIQREHANHQAALYLGAVLVALASIFILFHLARQLGRPLALERSTFNGTPFPIRLSRALRNISVRQALIVPSIGHGSIVLLYLTANVVFTFTNLNKNLALLSTIASRAAWMAMANLLLVVFLALKNTPLAILTSWSYERLNVLHRAAGYVTVVFVIIHGSCYSAYFLEEGRPEMITRDTSVYGIVAGFSFLGLAIAATVIRRWWYELFYYLHVTLWLVALFMVGLHQPDPAEKVLVITCVAGGIWILDRSIRWVRLAMYSTNTSVALTPLTNGATRVVVSKAPFGAVSGKHCFLWIPHVRLCETHPFTIAATNPLEFVVASYDGFTSDLHKHATRCPGASLRASVEGSYGTFPDPADYDKIILIAGGSGATFTFGVALNLLHRLAAETDKSAEFIWVVKDPSYLSWFSDHLETLTAEPRVRVRLFVSRPANTAAMIAPNGSDDSAVDKSFGAAIQEKELKQTPNKEISIDVEKAIASASTSDTDLTTPTSTVAPSAVLSGAVKYQRPDIPALIRGSIREVSADRRVVVMGCGPSGLMAQVRNTTATCIRADGPSVELHCEQFGW